MLIKLMKYEMRAIGRTLWPIYLAWILMGIPMGLIGLRQRYNTDGLPNIAVTLMYVAISVAAAVMTLMVIVRRFNRNLLGDEGYFMLTLPIPVRLHMWCKIITTAIWLCLSAIMVTIFVLLMFAFGGNYNLLLAATLYGLGKVKILKLVLFLLQCLLYMLLAFAAFAAKVYASICIGYMSRKLRTLCMVGAFIVFSTAEIILMTIVDTQLSDKLTTFTIGWVDGVLYNNPLVFCVTIAFIAVNIAIYCLITQYIMEKKLDI